MKRNFARTCGKCRSLMMLVLLMSFGTGLVLAADISGTWTFTVHTDGGDAHPTFIFKQEGEKLTGTYSGPMGEAKVTGTLKGNSAVFSLEGKNSQGGAVTASYSAKIVSATEMTGTVDFGKGRSLEWTATKK